MEIKRNAYLQEIIDRKGNGLIKVITGIRRSGKSYLLNTLFYNHLTESGITSDHIVKFAFDSEEDLSLIGEDYFELIESKRKVDPRKFSAYIKEKTGGNGTYYLLLDEVQELGAFEYVLNGFLYKKNLDVYVTGSNSKFLATDIITEFRGRGDKIHIYPLSFSEFLSGYSGDKYDAWKEYYTYGGMPLILSYASPKQKIEYLNELFHETYLRDLTERHGIRNEEEFGELLNVLASSIGSLTNPQKISNTFSSVKKSISPATAKHYIDCFTNAFMIDCAKRFDVKGRKYINTPSKYYFTDIGLRNARLDFRQQEENHIMENIIFNELKIRGYNVDVGVVEINEKDSSGKYVRKALEVDFIANQGSKKYYIQSAFEMSTSEKVEQERRSLVNIEDSFKKIIVVKDNIMPKRDDKGIVTMSVYDFLLNPDSLDI